VTLASDDGYISNEKAEEAMPPKADYQNQQNGSVRREPARPPATRQESGSVQRGAESSEDRFNRYVVPELEVLMRVARSITGNPTDADDLVQETLLRSYRAIHSFDGRSPRAWLLTIMRNAQINRTRRKRPQLMRNPDVTLALVADPETSTPESTIMDVTFDAAIERALATLPAHYREILHLVDVNGLSYEEASAIVGVRKGTVASRLYRARKLMRNELTTCAALSALRVPLESRNQ